MFVFCGTLMAVQADRHCGPFILSEDFKFKEEDKVFTGTDLVYNDILSTGENMKSA